MNHNIEYSKLDADITKDVYKIFTNEPIKDFHDWKKHMLSKAKKYRSECCKEREISSGCGTCRTCPFSFYNNRYYIPCKDLTDCHIINIYNLNKEDKHMTNEEALRKEIDETMKQLDILQKKLEEVKNEVPEELIIGTGDKYYYVSCSGDIHHTHYVSVSSSDVGCVHNRRAFLLEEYAEKFAKKTQFIADMLHFKYLYDRDYEPDWSNNTKPKWCVWYNGTGYECNANYTCRYPSVVYFSSEELAERCAKWLNKKYGYIKE